MVAVTVPVYDILHSGELGRTRLRLCRGKVTSIDICLTAELHTWSSHSTIILFANAHAFNSTVSRHQHASMTQANLHFRLCLSNIPRPHCLVVARTKPAPHFSLSSNNEQRFWKDPSHRTRSALQSAPHRTNRATNHEHHAQHKPCGVPITRRRGASYRHASKRPGGLRDLCGWR